MRPHHASAAFIVLQSSPLNLRWQVVMSGASQTGSILAFVLLFFLLKPPPSPRTTVRNKPIGSCGSACSNSE